jgi:hypothetical protein
MTTINKPAVAYYGTIDVALWTDPVFRELTDDAKIIIRMVTTAQFTKRKLVKPASVRTRLCLTGSYFGTVPTKLQNGRLAWPLRADEVA